METKEPESIEPEVQTAESTEADDQKSDTSEGEEQGTVRRTKRICGMS